MRKNGTQPYAKAKATLPVESGTAFKRLFGGVRIMSGRIMTGNKAPEIME